MTLGTLAYAAPEQLNEDPLDWPRRPVRAGRLTHAVLKADSGPMVAVAAAVAMVPPSCCWCGPAAN